MAGGIGWAWGENFLSREDSDRRQVPTKGLAERLVLEKMVTLHPPRTVVRRGSQGGEGASLARWRWEVRLRVG